MTYDGFIMSLRFVFLIYFIAVNVVTFAAYGIDKWKAVKGKWRIPEKRLILLAVFGGCVGAAAGMMIFHHKTKKLKFTIGIPLLFALQTLAVLGFYIWYISRIY